MIDSSIILYLVLFFIIIVIQLYQLWKNKNSNHPNFNEEIIKFSHSLDKSEKNINDQLQRNREEANKIAKENREELTSSLERFETNFNKNIKDVKETINQKLTDIREDNTKQLDKMRDTVDEKLQKTLEKRIGESFKQVSERLEEVHKGLGEMQNIASEVGDLKNVLANVKTRGVFGEYQLEKILDNHFRYYLIPLCLTYNFTLNVENKGFKSPILKSDSYRYLFYL